MNRTRTATTVLASLTAGAGLTTFVASGLVSGAAASAATTAGPETFTVTVHQGTESSLDLGAAGYSAGDQDLFTGPITRGGERVGRLVGSCTAARVGSASVDQLCEFVLRLRHGQITTLGTVAAGQSGPGTYALAVVGGTGTYAGASGQILVSPTDTASFPIQVRLR